MKYQLLDNNKFLTEINNSYMHLNKDNLYDYLKNILIKVKKKYNCDIYGYYDVFIYEIGNLKTAIEFIKKDKEDFFKNSIDLKINYVNKDVKILLDDYTILNRFSIYSKDIKDKDIIKICEHYSIENLNLQ